MVSESEEVITEPCSKKRREHMKKENPTCIAIAEVNKSKPKNMGETPPNPLSKNQLKKQKKRANFAEIKKERRLRERARLKQKRQEAMAQGLPRAGPSRKELKRKQINAKKEGEEGLRIVIDLDYDNLMHDKDIAKCVKQCLRIYTINRRSNRPAHIHFSGIKPDGRIHETFKKNDGYENWHVKFHFGASFTDVFPKEEIIYLTSESDEVLSTLEENKVYIIGGLVDHNHQKGLCHQRATQAGLRTARLPLNEHVDMKTRTVLSTYHVFEILMRVSEGKSWTDAILETIPLRKGAKPKIQDFKETQDCLNSHNQCVKTKTETDDDYNNTEKSKNLENNELAGDTKNLEGS